MRMYDMALGIFLLNLVMVMVNQIGLFPLQSINPPENFMDAETASDQIQEDLTQPVSAFTAFDAVNSVFLLLRSVAFFITTIALAPLGIAAVMISFHVPIILIVVITSVLSFIYFGAVVQFFRGRGFKGDE